MVSGIIKSYQIRKCKSYFLTDPNCKPGPDVRTARKANPLAN